MHVVYFIIQIAQTQYALFNFIIFQITLCKPMKFYQSIPHHNTTVLRPFFQDNPDEPVPEENFWTSWCKGKLTEADRQTIWLGASPSGLTSAHLHHPLTFLQTGCPSCHPTNSFKALKATRKTVIHFKTKVGAATDGSLPYPRVCVRNEGCQPCHQSARLLLSEFWLDREDHLPACWHLQWPEQEHCHASLITVEVMTGQHDEIPLSFLLAEHTKFAPDWCFGLTASVLSGLLSRLFTSKVR